MHTTSACTLDSFLKLQHRSPLLLLSTSFRTDRLPLSYRPAKRSVLASPDASAQPSAARHALQQLRADRTTARLSDDHRRSECCVRDTDVRGVAGTRKDLAAKVCVLYACLAQGRGRVGCMLRDSWLRVHCIAACVHEGAPPMRLRVERFASHALTRAQHSGNRCSPGVSCDGFGTGDAAYTDRAM